MEHSVFMERKDFFFDSHCHTMTLAQPNLTAFMENIFQNASPDLFKSLTSESNFSHSQSIKKSIGNILNLAALVQNDLDSIFKIMEDDLKGLYGGAALADDEGLKIGSRQYKNLVITPLLMDFKALPGAPNSTYYPQPLKDIRTTINEYAYAIRSYYKERPNGLLKIYPFLGINTAAYSFKEVETLLDESFSLYSGSLLNIRSRKLYTLVAGKLAPSRMFGGIKLYPPMGFDPWPDEKEERKKVNLLYDYAQSAQIPITAHCNESGYITIDVQKALIYTSPERWRPVLKKYPDLRLNLAHMGYKPESFQESLGRKLGVKIKKEKNWTEKVLDLIEEFPHVYTDISFNGINSDFYEYLQRILNDEESRRKVIEDKILFGTDFMINLTSIASYVDFYKLFEESPLNETQKHRFGSINPKKFLNM
jgi:predicted TIM-barrel fold metal-dependent hydrolase